MSQGKQAKILNQKQVVAVLNHLKSTRYPERNEVIFLLSIKAGLRAKEIALLTWGMVIDGSGIVNDIIQLEDKASKGKSGRTIPINTELRSSLTQQKIIYKLVTNRPILSELEDAIRKLAAGVEPIESVEKEQAKQIKAAAGFTEDNELANFLSRLRIVGTAGSLIEICLYSRALSIL